MLALRSRSLLVTGLVVVVLSAACAEAQNPQPQARFPDEGLQVTGSFGGKQIAVSSGNPTVTFGDCDREDGTDEDLCLTTRTIDGEEFSLVIENPAVLRSTSDGRVPVRPDACVEAACDEVTSHAVVDVAIAGEELRALSGTLEPRTVTTRQAAVGLRLTLGGGARLVGSFNVSR